MRAEHPRVRRGAQFTLGLAAVLAVLVGVGLLEPGTEASWAVAFGLLAIGPAIGVVAMWTLRRLPEATRMAGGRR